MNVIRCSVLCALCLLALVSGCSAPKSQKNSPGDAKTVVLFIPGYKGTTLADDHSKIKWVTPFEAIFGSTSLALSTENLGLPQALKLFPKKVLSEVVVVPWIYEFRTYGRFLDTLRSRLPVEVRLEEFPYDWRLSSASNSHILAEKVRDLRRNGAKKVILVGHSMGGTLTAYFLRYGSRNIKDAVSDWSGAKQVDGAVLVAAPFKGALNMYCDFQTGDPTAFHSTLLSKESLGTMESTYELLPEDGTLYLNGIPVEHITSSFWSKYHLGILRGKFSAEQGRAREQFVEHRLTNSRQFRGLLFNEGDDELSVRFPMYQFVGTGYATNASAEIDETSGECLKRLPADGDGIVTIESASLPGPYLKTLSPTVRVLHGEHAEILMDESVFQSIISLTQR